MIEMPVSRVAGEQRALDRRRAAPARQQRGMDVQRALRRGLEQRRRQEQAVGGDDQRVRLRGHAPRSASCGVLSAQRLEHGEPALRREMLDRARRRSHAAAGRPVGLRQNERDVVAGVQQARQRARGELGRAGEDEAQESGRQARLAQLLGELGADALLLELRQVLDEHLALQVIHLVLDADREQALRFEREGIAVLVVARAP